VNIKKELVDDDRNNSENKSSNNASLNSQTKVKRGLDIGETSGDACEMKAEHKSEEARRKTVEFIDEFRPKYKEFVNLKRRLLLSEQGRPRRRDHPPDDAPRSTRKS
jgi:hypothetical protein